MEAGRVLDKLIDERVMGRVWDESRCRVCGWPLATDIMVSSAGCMSGNCSMRPQPERRADEPPPYSTDIAAAWTVVEHLIDRGMDVQVQATRAMINYYTRVTNARGKYQEEWGDTAPLVICRAALAACGVVTE